MWSYYVRTSTSEFLRIIPDILIGHIKDTLGGSCLAKVGSLFVIGGTSHVT